MTNPAIGARCDLHAMLIEAALAGLGVALVPRLYVETELAQGRLVAPWPEGKTISKIFCLVLPESIGLSGEPIKAFAQWILDEAKKPSSTRHLSQHRRRQGTMMPSVLLVSVKPESS